ncbi:MAG: hypothetical protein ACP6KW_08160 [Candidatus Thorarchaeota archaeon]
MYRYTINVTALFGRSTVDIVDVTVNEVATTTTTTTTTTGPHPEVDIPLIASLALNAVLILVVAAQVLSRRR